MPALFVAFDAATAWQAAKLQACAAITGFLGTMAYITSVFPRLREQM